MITRCKIQQRIKDIGTTQRNVSKEIDVSEQSLSNFLKGIRAFPYKKYVRLLEAIGFTIGIDGCIGKYPALDMPTIIRERIVENDIKIKDIASTSNVNSSSLSSFLTKKRGLSVTAIERVADNLGLDYVCYGLPFNENINKELHDGIEN